VIKIKEKRIKKKKEEQAPTIDGEKVVTNLSNGDGAEDMVESKKVESKKEELQKTNVGGAEEKIELKKEEPKRAKRATSNVFASLNPSQIQEYKEVCMQKSE